MNVGCRKATPLNGNEELRVSDHSLLQVTTSLFQAHLGAFTPLSQSGIAAFDTQRSLKGSGVDKDDHRGDVAKAQRGQDTGADWGSGHVQRLTQPQKRHPLSHFRIQAIQRAVCGQFLATEDIDQTCRLEERSATLCVTGQGLLRHDIQRVAR